MKESQSKSNDLLKAAEYYLSLGWSVIPVNADKTPLVDWKKYQSEKPTKEDLDNWFSGGTVSGVAIITGKISGLLVLDYEAGQKIPKFSGTPTVITGGNGKHVYFSLPDNTSIRSSARPLGKKHLMDVRAEGGYVLAPPSLHKSGKRYKWENEISDFNLVKLPDIYRMALENNVSAADSFEVIVEGISEGHRHDSAVRLTGLLLSKFQSNQWKSFVWPLISAWNLQNKPPLPHAELARIYTDIGRKELSKNETVQTTSNINTLSLDELMAEPDVEADWLVNRLIPNGGITIIAGRASNFKTWILLHLALSVTTGEKVFGHFDSTKASVLIVDEENQKKTLRKRLTMLGYKKGLNLFFMVQSGFKITNKRNMNDLAHYVKAKNIQLVIFDSLVRVHDKDENTSTGMAEVFSIVKQLNRLGAAVLFTHHNRKQDGGDSAQGMRGSSDILAAVDAQMYVARQGEFITIEQNKNRDAEELMPFSVLIKSDEETMSLEYQGEATEKLNKSAQAEFLILDLLKLGSKTRTEIITELSQYKIGVSKIGEALQKLVAGQKVVEESGEHNKKRYYLPDAE